MSREECFTFRQCYSDTEALSRPFFRGSPSTCARTAANERNGDQLRHSNEEGGKMDEDPKVVPSFRIEKLKDGTCFVLFF